MTHRLQQTFGFTFAIIALSVFMSFASATLASANSDVHRCTHCLSQNNACCPGQTQPAQAEQKNDVSKHACSHCAKQKHACCPEEKHAD
jgi:hypothetical protein